MNFLTAPVLVLDAETRTALAVVRSLGRAGYRTIAASSNSAALAKSSRYCGPKLDCPDPNLEPKQFVEWLISACGIWRPAMILPLTDVTVTLCSQIAERLEGAALPLPSYQAILQASNKQQLIARALQLGIASPKTVEIVGTGDERIEELRTFPYPAVLKPSVTAAATAGSQSFVKIGVSYPQNFVEVQQVITRARQTGIECSFLLQEKISGAGVGVFALCENGRALVTCAHRRLLEKPPSGGVSVLSESIPLNEAPVDQATRLLADLNWDGAAMVEFKLRDSGEPVLMEINPRFWGSLQLVIDSGCDLPTLLTGLVTADRSSGQQERQIEEIRQASEQYRPGKRLRWLLGTVDHSIIRLKREGLSATIGMLARNELKLFQRLGSSRNETLRIDDPFPAVAELKEWLRGPKPSKARTPAARQLRILQFIETGGAGGAERVVSVLVQALVEFGHTVEVASSRTGWLTDTLASIGIRHHHIPSNRRLDHTLPLRLKNLLRSGGFDLLHSHLLDSNFYGSIAAKMAGVPHLGTEHGDVHHPAGKKLLKTKLRTAAVLGSQYSSVSNYSALRLVELGVPGRIISRIPNPIQQRFFEIGRNRLSGSVKSGDLRRSLGLPEAFTNGRLWLHTASIRPVKDQETLIRGFAQAGPGQCLAIVGDGPGRGSLEDLAADLGIANRIHFAGFRNDVEKWLEAADGFILSSKSESMPMALLEAGAAGLTLISSDVGGVSEVLPGEKFGFLFPSGDYQALGEIIRGPASDEALCRLLIEQSMQHTFRHFSLERVIRDYVALYNTMLIERQ
jgi:glycosyltransferase involved in cell wall biosynthesis/predicted ATP-grasp superfamily ATP-dependent carboligase